MSFGFQFSDDEIDEEYIRDNVKTMATDNSNYGTHMSSGIGSAADNGNGGITQVGEEPQCRESMLDELIDSLPERLSYTPVRFPLRVHNEVQGSTNAHHGPHSATLVRRDLFDARFQLMVQEEADNEDRSVAAAVDQRADNPTPNNTHQLRTDAIAHALSNDTNDLVPGVYEGGLKTWECSFDLASTLDSYAQTHISLTSAENETERIWGWLWGRDILELGCGTAIPTLFLLSKLLHLPKPKSPPPRTRVHLWDFNYEVLKLVTFPNVLLTWYFSPARTETFDSTNLSTTAQAPGEIDLTPDMLDAFRRSLAMRNIDLRFFAGAWTSSMAGFEDSSEENSCTCPYNIVLSSETVYSPASLPSFVDVLHRATAGAKDDHSVLCLVACKTLYFGIGGGAAAFCSEVAARGGSTNDVYTIRDGVGRSVLRVTW